MKKVIITVASTFAVLIIGFLLFISSGAYNISAVSPHNGLTRWIIHTLKDNSIEKRDADIQVPNLNDTTLIRIGFEHYNEMCVDCHGAQGIEQSEWAKGMYPDPPRFYRHASRMDPKETFWTIKNGIKMTGMPAFGPTHSDQKIWAMTAFIKEKLQNMTPDEYNAWKEKYSEKEEKGEHHVKSDKDADGDED